jgi:cytochrome c-type biogenesis protein CcmH/NrfG
MTTDRIAALRRMLERNPGDARALFGLALEYERAGDWAAAADALRSYLDRADDEGNAWGRLANALVQLGRTDDACDAYRRGIDTANRHGHPTMAFEFQEALAELDG